MKESSRNRRHFLGFASGALALLSSRVSRSEDADPATRARTFLDGLYDPELELLPEFPGSKVYWLYHDNYLAAKVLAKSDPGRSRSIREAVRRYGVTGSGKIEILFGEAGRPLPFRHYQWKDLA